MRITLCNCERVILDELAAPNVTMKDIALTYAMTIESGETVDWLNINQAIIAKWGVKKFVSVKTKAWKLLREKYGGGRCRDIAYGIRSLLPHTKCPPISTECTPTVASATESE